MTTEGVLQPNDLQKLPRTTLRKDLHCVTTWTKRDLLWSGWRFVDLYRTLIEPQFGPKSGIQCVVFYGIDGYRCSLSLEDALNGEILIADSLDGEALSPIHGAPLRVVCPDRYGYKNLKHLTGFGFRDQPLPGLRLGLEHPRGRVERQERHAVLPPWMVRLPFRALIRPTSWMHRRGLTSQDFVGTPTALNQIMPTMDTNEVHDLYIDASPEQVFRQLLATTGSEIRLMKPLMSLRALPSQILGRRSPDLNQQPILESLQQFGFVELETRDDREIVLGTVGRFWSLIDNQPVSLEDRSEFLSFEEPGYVKAAMNFIVRAEGLGCRLVTETRIVGTNDVATRRFRRYWRLIRPGSGMIRRSWLAAISRRVKAATLS